MAKQLKVLMMPDYREGNPFQQLLADSLTSNGVDVVFTKGYKRVFPIYRETKKYDNLDLLHLHWITPYLKGKNLVVFSLYAIKFILDLLITRYIANKKIVWTIHNQVTHDAKFPRTEILVYRLTSKIIDAAILHGSTLKEIILNDYKLNEDQLSIIHLGNYKKVYPPLMPKLLARQNLGITSDIKKVFLHQGLLKPYKGIEDLIEMWNHNAAQFEGNMLVIAGKPADDLFGDRLKSLVNSNGSILFILRYVTNEEITLLYSACDAVVLPFRKIMASSSVMVAISFGKPVIAPRLGASEELLGDANELLYEVQNGDEGLRQSMIHSMKIDLMKLEQKTSARADLFNWDVIGLKTYNLYKKVLAS